MCIWPLNIVTFIVFFLGRLLRSAYHKVGRKCCSNTVLQCHFYRITCELYALVITVCHRKDALSRKVHNTCYRSPRYSVPTDAWLHWLIHADSDVLTSPFKGLSSQIVFVCLLLVWTWNSSKYKIVVYPNLPPHLSQFYTWVVDRGGSVHSLQDFCAFCFCYWTCFKHFKFFIDVARSTDCMNVIQEI